MLTEPRVLLLDRNDERRAATCALAQRAGYPAVGSASVHQLVRHIDEALQQVLLFDVSVPLGWFEVIDVTDQLRSRVAERCPIVLYGHREETDLCDLEWATRSASHCVARPDNQSLFALLRRLLPDAAPPPSRTTRPPSLSFAKSAVASRRVLLVDDSEITLELVQSLLMPLGFDIRIAVALGEIRSIVAYWKPDVIVADVKRPDIQGADLCARLKSSVESSGVMILLTSSLPDEALSALARDAGADGWVSKGNRLDLFVANLLSQMERMLPNHSLAAQEAR